MHKGTRISIRLSKTRLGAAELEFWSAVAFWPLLSPFLSLLVLFWTRKIWLMIPPKKQEKMTTQMMPVYIRKIATLIILCANSSHKSLNGAKLLTTLTIKIKRQSQMRFMKIYGRINGLVDHFLIKFIF